MDIRKISKNVRQIYVPLATESRDEKIGGAREGGRQVAHKRINKIDSARAERKTTEPTMSPRWIFSVVPGGCTWICARANAPNSTGRRDAIRCTVIVFYWRRVVPACPFRMSLARPTSRAASPATSASGVARRVACRKWIHRCRVLMNQISITITAIMRHFGLFRRSVRHSDSLSTQISQ